MKHLKALLEVFALFIVFPIVLFYYCLLSALCGFSGMTIAGAFEDKNDYDSGYTFY